MSFDANDPSLNHVVSGAGEVQNKAGLFGAYAAGFLNDVFGVAALIWPLIFGALGAAYVSPAYAVHWWRWCGFFLLTICLLVTSAAWDFSIGDLWGGGMVGKALHENSSRYLSPGGSALVWLFVLLVGLQLACNISWFTLAGRAAHWLHGWLEKRFQISIPFLRQQQAADGTAEAAQSDAAAGTAKTVPLKKKRASGPEIVGVADNGDVAHNAAGAGATEAESAPGTPARAWFGLRLWQSLRARLQPEPTTTDQMPEVYEEQPAAPSAAHRASVPVYNDDPFAETEDVVSLAAAEARRTAGTPDAGQEEAAADSQQADSASAVKEQAATKPAAQGAQAGSGSAGQDAPASAAHTPQAPAAPASSGAGRKQGSFLPNLLGRRAPVPLPSLELLKPAPRNRQGARRDELEARGRALMDCFREFDIQGELVRITPGPVVTMFEVRPAPGIRVNRIANLSDDLALALKAIAVRIQAPIPGSDTVGIEIPNADRETVNFRELASSEAFRKGCGPLTMILGKDIAGQPFMADLTKMPHLLVAGATGAGKSVCLNAILISLLYHTQPQDMRLLLVDPKRIEMAVYADEPHLVHPVVTEMAEAKNALDWAVHEMDRRYRDMALLGVRNVAGYNQKLATFKNDLPPDYAHLEHMPYLVIVIDELADLMMTAAREVETSIVRLAQLARAAGIHMILATQRPSVDVVTGLIKANFPCRISFQVSSKHDSRTILDQMGAEHLLGRGDMLFKPSGGRLQRLHGPFLGDDEVQAVVDYWKHHLKPSYEVDFSQWGQDGAAGGSATGGGDAAQDPLYAEAQAFVAEQGKASISLLQRRFKIGFNRAARLVEQMERDGLLGPADGSKPRSVVK